MSAPTNSTLLMRQAPVDQTRWETFRLPSQASDRSSTEQGDLGMRDLAALSGFRKHCLWWQIRKCLGDPVYHVQLCREVPKISPSSEFLLKPTKLYWMFFTSNVSSSDLDSEGDKGCKIWFSLIKDAPFLFPKNLPCGLRDKTWTEKQGLKRNAIPR